MDKKWWTLVAVCLGTFMLLLDVTIVNVALPDIQHSLHTSFSDLQWVVDAYALTLAALLVTTGSLADLFGRRTLFTVGLVIFTAGSLLCGLAQSSEMLILSRAGQGIGGAAMFSTSLALLAQAFQGRERGTAFGIWGSITGVAVAIGPVLGGVLTSGLSWRWIFFVNIPVGVIAVALTLIKVSESRQPGAQRPDWLGFITFTAALVGLIYGLIRAGQRGWTSEGVLLCFGGAAAALVVFLIVETVTKRPMFDLALFKKPTFVGGSIAAFGLSASLFALLLYIVLFLQDIRGYSALGTGMRLLILSGGIMVAATIAGRATNKVPIRFLIAPGLVLVGVGLFLMSRLSPTSPWTDLIPGLIVAGIGTGMVNPPLASTAVGVVEPARSGMASGINSTFRQVGIATGTAALGSILGSAVVSRVTSDLSGINPAGLSPKVLAAAVSGGGSSAVIAHVPTSLQPFVERVVNDAYVHSLDRILLIGAATAAVAGVFSLALVRAKDFAAGSQGHRPQAAPDAPSPAGDEDRATTASLVDASPVASAGASAGVRPAMVGAGAAGGSAGLGAAVGNGGPASPSSTNGAANGSANGAGAGARLGPPPAAGAGASPAASASAVSVGPASAASTSSAGPADSAGPTPVTGGSLVPTTPTEGGAGGTPDMVTGQNGAETDDRAADDTSTRELSVSLTFRLRRPGRRPKA